jgi:DNA mismatch repair protein MutS
MYKFIYKKKGIYYSTYLIGTNKLYNDIPLLLNFKRPYKKTKINNNHDPLMVSFIIKKKGIGKYCGFETDKNKRFLLNSFIVTHNSSIMKAIGTTLIMAQCGLYVPADSFEYGIFDSLYTRISGNDNLFKGQSSFIIEMNELRTILKKSTAKSLIIGDEICRGTEYLSANALVASSILELVDLGAKFLFATHLHELAEMEEIKTLNTIKFYHLSVEKRGDELIFNRKMIEGTGEQNYGITVAQYILDNNKFINRAIELKNSLLKKSGINTRLVSDKKSLYNKEIYMDTCTICGSQDKLESHHINMQKDFVLDINGHGQINNNKKHILKDSKANLIVLCSKCHNNLHSGNFTISGLVKSSNGITVI